MSKYFLDVVTEEATMSFPVNTNRRTSETYPFNVSGFSERVYGPGRQKSWRERVNKPYGLTVDEAARMADALGRPLSEMIAEASRRMRMAHKDVPTQERTGTLGA